MTKVIWKYPVPLLAEVKIGMPSGAQILTVQKQAGEPYIWVLVDPSAPLVERTFTWVGTGHDHPDAFWDPLQYVGTIQFEGGALVFHLFVLR